MSVRRIVGLVLALVGVAGIFYANMQQGRINKANSDAQKKISQGEQLFQGDPVAEMFGNSVAGSAKKKVASKVAKYEQMVERLKIGSIGVIVIGAVLVVLSMKKKLKKR